jgi:RNA-binding protein
MSFALPLTNAEKRALKARAQRLDPIVKIGRAGVTSALLGSLDAALGEHGLVKVRFAEFKEEKKTLAPQLAAQTGSELVMRVGNVAVYYRPPRSDAMPSAPTS